MILKYWFWGGARTARLQIDHDVGRCLIVSCCHPTVDQPIPNPVAIAKRTLPRRIGHRP